MTISALLLDHFWSSLTAICAISLSSYIIYQRFLHPLSKYPGPFWASITDLWQVREYLSLKQPYHLTDLHSKYGPFVRYGPDKLSTTCESAVALVYQKGGRHMPKTEFYDAFGGLHPNVFGTRDEAIHSTKRRHMSHSFSITSVKEMEECFDSNIAILRKKILQHALTGEVFDLKRALRHYVVDVLGDLAFSQSFGVQLSDDESLVPPVIEHSLLASATGAWPAMTATLKKWLPVIPYRPLQDLFAGRQACIALASKCVRKRLDDLSSVRDDDNAIKAQRKDLLTSLIFARDPETGERLSQIELEVEAFGFIIAGTHTTSATTTLLFYHLLRNPDILSKLVEEVDTNLPDLEPSQCAHSITQIEASCPYLRDCVKENFRINPVFTMPLERRVTVPEGIVIDGEHIKQGTSIAICNHAFHHNPAVWGLDHNVFRPSRWDDPEVNARSRLLMHFGLGGRQCIGKSIATTNIYKVVCCLLREFEFTPEVETIGKVSKEISESPMDGDRDGEGRNDVPDLVSVGVSELEGPLFVRCKKRSRNL